MDYISEYPAAIEELARGLNSGAIKRKFHIIEGGIEQAPVALPMLFSGGNTGKLYVFPFYPLLQALTLAFRVVKVSEEPNFNRAKL
jgi:hypothetical protein